MVAVLLQSYKATGCNVSLKVHFLDFHLEYFPENFGATNGEHRERFHQGIQPWTSGTKARGAPVCWSIIAGHLEQKFHGPNGAESHPQLLVT